MRICQPLAIALLCGWMLQSLVGCARWDCNSQRDAWETELRTLASVACRNQFGEVGQDAGCNADYREGWTEGYYQVLGGRSGEPPVVPASHYWEPESRHANNLHRVGDWRRGFIDGASAAHQCGQHGYATVPAAAPAPPQHAGRPIYTVDCFANLAPDGMLNAPARELPPMPMPLPPTLEQLDGQPELDHKPDSDDLLPSPSDLPREPAATPDDDEDLLLGAAPPQLDAAFARLKLASQAMRQAGTVPRQRTPQRLPSVADSPNTAVLR